MNAPLRANEHMAAAEIPDVPRYYRPYASDCFTNAYGALIAHQGLDPDLILADYLNFMYDPASRMIGNNFLSRYSTSSMFSEEELNSSMAFVQFSATTEYEPGAVVRKLGDPAAQVGIRLLVHDDPEVAHARAAELIRSGRPAVVLVNMHEMSYHQAYRKEHGIHCVVLTGHDEARGEYRLFDKFLMSNSDYDGTMSVEEITRARNTAAQHDNPIMGAYTRQLQQLWMEVEISSDIRVEAEKLRKLVRTSVRRMRGEEQVLGQPCGLARIAAFREGMLEMKDATFDACDIFLFRSYYNHYLKGTARQRKRFRAFLAAASTTGLLAAAPPPELLALLDDAAMRWDICANLALKLGITRKPVLLDDMAAQLQQVEETERKVTDGLERWIG